MELQLPDVKNENSYKSQLIPATETKSARVLISYAELIHFYVYKTNDGKPTAGKIWYKVKDLPSMNKRYILHMGYRLGMRLLSPPKPKSISPQLTLF